MLSNSTKFRRIVGGMSLIIAPLFLLIATLLQTRGGSDPTSLLAEIAKRPLANEVSFFFALYGFVLFIPAAIALAHLFQKRAVVLGHLGASLLVLGMVSFAFIAGTETLLYIAGANSSIQSEILIVNEQLGKSVVYNIINLTEVFGWLLGTLFIAIALFKIKVIPRIYSILLGLGIFLRFVLAGSYMGTVFCEVLYFIAFAYVGLKILRMSDNEWSSFS